MIETNITNSLLSSEFFSNRITLILEDQTTTAREDITALFTSLEANKYYGMVGRENNMIPFLSILDNLLLGISKKKQDMFLRELNSLLDQFKLHSLNLSDTAKTLSKNEQLILQMIRALILNQIIIIFDAENESDSNNTFLINLMPILKKIAQKYETTLIITSKNKHLANSIYYDQCLPYEYLSKKE